MLVGRASFQAATMPVFGKTKLWRKRPEARDTTYQTERDLAK